MKTALSLTLLALFALPVPALAQSRVATFELERRGPYAVHTEERTWFDARRRRPVPIRLQVPQASAGALPPSAQPLIIFSHGLGGSPDGYRYFSEHLASHGFAVLLLQHVGSDSTTAAQGLLALIRAATDPQNAIDRPLDVSFAIDQAISLRRTDRLFRFVDVTKIGVAGHSFGAYTALAAVGQTIRTNGRTLSFLDSRIDCAIAMSTQGPGTIGLTRRSWDAIDVPAMTMTGTQDTGLGTHDVADRRVAFESMPPGQKYHLTIENAEHLAFSNSSRPGTVRDPRHHGWILAAATGFYRSYLKDDASARRWLARRKLQRDTLGEVVQEQR
jgi:predicted dienelactone hydrolase